MLTPGGSSTIHIYTQTIHRTTQLIWEERGPFPVFTSYTLAFALQLRKKHGKTSVIRKKILIPLEVKVRELFAVKVLHNSLLNTTVVSFKVLTLGSYAPMPAASLPFETILELVLWNGLHSCRCINPDVVNVIKMLSFQYFLYLREQKKVTGG